MDWKRTLDDLAALIEEGFGKPCDDRSPICAGCVAWRAYEDIKYLAELDVDEAQVNRLANPTEGGGA